MRKILGMTLFLTSLTLLTAGYIGMVVSARIDPLQINPK